MPLPAPPLNIALRPSRRLQILWLALYVGVCLILLLLPMPALVRLALLLVWGLLAWRAYLGWRRLCGIRALHIYDERLRVSAGEQSLAVELRGAPLNVPGLVILPLKSHSQVWQLVLLGDSAAADDLRRLRVWLGGRKAH